MFRANDINGNSVFIDDVDKNSKYFCHACGEPLILKIFGTRKRHYFSHFPRTICKDNWNYEPMSKWHLNWQNWFNKENREVWIKGDNESHRADISINNTIIEFQHSFITNTEFNKRNKFYTSCNKNVVWIFDMKKHVSLNSDGTFSWEKGNKFESTFVDFTNYNNQISIYFEIEKIIDNHMWKILIPIINFNERRYFQFNTFNCDLIDLNFLKDYIDLSNIEKMLNTKIYSITELLKFDNNNKQNNNIVSRQNQQIVHRGPNEWYLKMNRKNSNYKVGIRPSHNYRKWR